MKLFRESLIIFGIYLLGEFISKLFDIPIPGNVLGLIILLILLCTNIIKPSQIENISNFLLDHLAFFFIPAGVQLMSSFGLIKDSWAKLLIICVISTIVVIACTGLIVQTIFKKTNQKGDTTYLDK